MSSGSSQESSQAPAAPVSAPAQGSGAGRSAGLVGGGVILAALAKGKVLLVALKALSLGKLLLTFGTMFAAVLFYASHNGWAFGAGFVLMLLIHELGHAVAIRAAGLRAGYPVFIPGFGALIALKDQPRDPRVEAEIALAGPVAGGVAALSAAALYYVSHDRLFLALASTGFMLNLFNMIPLSPLDGGRVANLFSRRAWIAGLAMVAAMFVMTQAPMLLLIGLFALRNLWGRRASTLIADPGDVAPVTASERRAMATRYFGLCAFLAFGFYFANRLLAA